MRDEVLRQFDSAPPERHHRLTLAVLSESSSLGQAVRLMNPDGTGMTKELAMVVRGLSLAPMDDSKGEEPHARADRENKQSRAAKWPYLAASLRVKENLVDIRVRTDAPPWRSSLNGWTRARL